MNQTTKKQHYIWRSYLAPWTDDRSKTGKLWCLREKKIFFVSLTNIAHENYFYGIRELSALEKRVIYEMAVKNTGGSQRKTNEGWLQLYCAPFDSADETARLWSLAGRPMDRAEILAHENFKAWTAEGIELLHGHIETAGAEYLERLRQGDLSFWESEESRDQFSFFLCSQYFRTKRIRDSIAMVFETGRALFDEFQDIRPENLWLPLSLIFASNMGAHVAFEYSPLLLKSEDSCFLVGDQPVVNTLASFSGQAPEQMELYYPLTPHTALLLSKGRSEDGGRTLVIGSQEVERYNRLEVRASLEQVFASDRTQLEALL